MGAAARGPKTYPRRNTELGRTRRISLFTPKRWVRDLGLEERVEPRLLLFTALITDIRVRNFLVWRYC